MDLPLFLLNWNSHCISCISREIFFWGGFKNKFHCYRRGEDVKTSWCNDLGYDLVENRFIVSTRIQVILRKAKDFQAFLKLNLQV